MMVTTMNIENMIAKASVKYPTPKYLIFCKEMLRNGLQVELKPSRSTVSKYVFISNGDKTIKIRFSNHRPAYRQQEINDSDYYVGVSHFGCITTENLIPIIIKKLRRYTPAELIFLIKIVERQNFTCQSECEDCVLSHIRQGRTGCTRKDAEKEAWEILTEHCPEYVVNKCL